MTLTNSIPGCSIDVAEEDRGSPAFKDKGCAACCGSFTKLVLEVTPLLLDSTTGVAEHRKEEEIGNGMNTAEDIANVGSLSDC
jgi:hypothetical protein